MFALKKNPLRYVFVRMCGRSNSR